MMFTLTCSHMFLLAQDQRIFARILQEDQGADARAADLRGLGGRRRRQEVREDEDEAR